VTSDDPTRGAPGLVSDALGHLSRIIRGEVALARSEVAVSLHQARHAFVLLIVAVVLSITALNVLSASLVAWVMRAGLAPHWATLAIGTGFAIAAAIGARIGFAALRSADLVPTRTIEGLRRDAETLKEGLTP
jgi:Putative Actinobacterial Holin-X, holin superfamily III